MEALDFKQHLRKCRENSMANMYSKVESKRLMALVICNRHIEGNYASKTKPTSFY